MPVRVADTVAQQHDRPEAHTSGLAGGGGSAGEKQTAGPGRAERAAGRREEAEAHVDRGARETVPGGVLRRAAETVGREDRGHRGETRSKEERGQGVVLQSAAKTETHEVRRPALTGCHAIATCPFNNPFLQNARSFYSRKRFKKKKNHFTSVNYRKRSLRFGFGRSTCKHQPTVNKLLLRKPFRFPSDLVFVYARFRGIDTTALVPIAIVATPNTRFHQSIADNRNLRVVHTI